MRPGSGRTGTGVGGTSTCPPPSAMAPCAASRSSKASRPASARAAGHPRAPASSRRSVCRRCRPTGAQAAPRPAVPPGVFSSTHENVLGACSVRSPISARPYSPRVLVVSYTGQAGGSGRNLIDFLDAIDPRPVVAVPEGPVAAGPRAAGATVIVLPERPRAPRRAAWGGPGSGHPRRELRRLARALEPALVVAWGMRTALAATFALARRPPGVPHPDLPPAARRPGRSGGPRGPRDVLCVEGHCRRPGPGPGCRWCPTASTWPACDRPEERAADGPDARGDHRLEAPRPCARGAAGARLPEARLRLVGEPLAGAGRRCPTPARARQAARPRRPGRSGGRPRRPGGRAPAAACLLHCADRRALRPGDRGGSRLRPAGGGSGRRWARRDGGRPIRPAVSARRRRGSRAGAGGGPGRRGGAGRGGGPRARRGGARRGAHPRRAAGGRGEGRAVPAGRARARRPASWW